MKPRMNPKTDGSLQSSIQDQRGFTLAALLVILTVLAVVIAYSVPPMWSDVLKRERDIETIWTMKQYARAIAEFQRKRGVLPTTLDQLKEQKDPRVIRALFNDPLTGKLDWVLIPPGAPGAPVAPGPAGNPNQPPRPAGNPNQPPGTSGATGGAKDYVGPFIGVRPPIRGKSYVSLNGTDQYENWSFTIADLQRNPAGSSPVAPGVGPRPCRNPQCT